MQVVTFGKPFDRGDVEIVNRYGKRHAGGNAAAIDMHGAGATLAVIAALLGPGQAKLVAQHVEQRAARIKRKCTRRLVDAEGDVDFRAKRRRQGRIGLRQRLGAETGHRQNTKCRTALQHVAPAQPSGARFYILLVVYRHRQPRCNLPTEIESDCTKRAFVGPQEKKAPFGRDSHQQVSLLRKLGVRLFTKSLTRLWGNDYETGPVL